MTRVWTRKSPNKPKRPPRDTDTRKQVEEIKVRVLKKDKA